MRINLTLSHRKPSVNLPVNCYHLLSSLIYNIVDQSSSEYAERLHEQGYLLQNRSFKLFTFSPLSVAAKGQKWHFRDDGMMSTRERLLQFTISSPKNEFIEHLVIGLLHQPVVRVGQEQFRVETVRRLDPPEFTSDMRFVALSPLVCSTKNNHDRYTQFLFPDDEEFEQKLYANLLRKYEALHGKPYPASDSRFCFTLDTEYCERNRGRLQKLIIIKEGKPDETLVKGTLAPFRLEAPPELMETGYDCGFGERNSQGFGMVKLDTYHANPV
ncbi:MAG: CRISPR-associated endoribonuclease Cas6 [Chlorobiaceae bacterium]|nr:CRISPR-associated endoribonuclease Cas6 [Chlorobiaceae bacterium]